MVLETARPVRPARTDAVPIQRVPGVAAVHVPTLEPEAATRVAAAALTLVRLSEPEPDCAVVPS